MVFAFCRVVDSGADKKQVFFVYIQLVIEGSIFRVDVVFVSHYCVDNSVVLHGLFQSLLVFQLFDSDGVDGCIAVVKP